MEYNLKEKERDLLGIFLIFLCVFLVVLIVSKAIDIQNKLQETENTITVTESGEIYARPDLAVVNFSVVTEKKTVEEALAENTKNMNGIIDFAKNQGVEEKDLKTAGFNIYPRYEWYEKECLTYPCPAGERVLVGYEVTQTLEVKIRDMTKIGEILQGATDAGANQVGNLQFTVDKQDEFKKQAREEAIRKAKSKARELASQLGIKLIRIANFSEGVSVPRYGYALTEEAAMGGAGEPVPQIEAGENKITVMVNITYEIR